MRAIPGDPVTTIARAHLVDPAVTRWYHCVTRCVRRAFLLGEGMHDRKSWIAGVIRCRFIFSGKNDELTPDFPPGGGCGQGLHPRGAGLLDVSLQNRAGVEEEGRHR